MSREGCGLGRRYETRRLLEKIVSYPVSTRIDRRVQPVRVVHATYLDADGQDLINAGTREGKASALGTASRA